MKIAIDAMGGDNAPEAIIKGTLQAVENYGANIILVGERSTIEKELNRWSLSSAKKSKIQIYHASETVEMGESPISALRKKKRSSIRIAIELVRSGEAMAFISAGNTGAVMATAKVILGTLNNVDRPAIATVIPTLSGKAVLIDVGANVDCKPHHLLQFAIMGYVYARDIMGIKIPRVGLLNIGEEEGKGNELTKAAFDLMKNNNFNFIGNVEGGKIFGGEVDVVVSDGFIGNIALKIGESVAEMIEELLKREFKRRVFARIGYMLSKPVFKTFKKKVDYSEYGGAHLLGLKGICIICHGKSKDKAIKNAIKVALDSIHTDMISHLQKTIEKQINNRGLSFSGVA